MIDPIKLPDNIPEALNDIAKYLKWVNMGIFRAVHDTDGDVMGYYQTTKYLQGLLDIADECERLRSDML